MAENPLKYTEEELVDFGWNEIESQLPRKKRRPIFFWFTMAAAVLGLLVVGKYLVDFNNQNNQSKIVENTDNNNIAKKNNSSNADVNDSFITESQEISNDYNEQKSSTNNITNALSNNNKQKSATRQQLTASNNTLLNNSDLSNNTTIQKNGLTQNNLRADDSRIEPSIIKSTGIDKPLKSAVNSNIYQQKNIIPSDNNVVSKNNESNHSVKENSVIDETEGIAEDISNNVENEDDFQETKKSTARKSLIKAFAGGEAITNQFENIGFQLRGGVQYQLTEKNALNAELQIGMMKEDLESFTQFDNPNDLPTNSSFPGISSAFASNDEQDYVYDAIVIELPISYSHKLSEKVSVSGGVTTNYTNFKKLNDSEFEEILVGIQDPQDPNNVSNYYVITQDFVDQFDQLSIGANLGASLRLNDKVDLDVTSGFAFQSLTDMEFLDYKPNIIQAGAKYYIFKKKGDE